MPAASQALPNKPSPRCCLRWLAMHRLEPSRLALQSHLQSLPTRLQQSCHHKQISRQPSGLQGADLAIDLEGGLYSQFVHMRRAVGDAAHDVLGLAASVLRVGLKLTQSIHYPVAASASIMPRTLACKRLTCHGHALKPCRLPTCRHETSRSSRHLQRQAAQYRQRRHHQPTEQSAQFPL